MLTGKRFGSNKEETETYFEAKNKSFYKKRTEMLKKHWNVLLKFRITIEEIHKRKG